jgi:hypothetical protein
MNDDNPSGTFASVAEPPVFEIGTFVVPSWLRLAARLFATSLDEKLAAGQHPATSHLLAVRSQQLVSPRYRRGIADSWLHLLIEVRRPYNRLAPMVPLLRSDVLEAEDQIRSLAEVLVSPLPTVRGVAMSILTLRDGAGPLFNRNSHIRVIDAVKEILGLLDPLAPVNAA